MLRKRLIAASVTATMGAALLMPVAAQASGEGKRNTAIALGVAALLLLSQSHRSSHSRDCDRNGYYDSRNDRYSYDNDRYYSGNDRNCDVNDRYTYGYSGGHSGYGYSSNRYSSDRYSYDRNSYDRNSYDHSGY